MSQRKPLLSVYCGCRENSLGHSVLIWFLTAVWTGNAGILCLCLPLTQAPRIALSSVGPKPPPSSRTVLGKS